MATAPPDGAILALLLADDADASQAIAPAAANDGGSPLLALLLADADAPTAPGSPAPAPSPGLLIIQTTAGAAVFGIATSGDTPVPTLRTRSIDGLRCCCADPIGCGARPDVERY